MFLTPLTLANIQWSDEKTAINLDSQDRYFSDQPLAESEYVYLLGNKLRERWRRSHGHTFTIVELGFGSGLNFLLTQRLWQKTKQENQNNFAHLNYISIERSPVSTENLQKFYGLWPELKQYSAQLLKKLPMPTPGRHLIQFPAETHSADGSFASIDLYLEYGVADQVLTLLIEENNCRADAFFLDGFNPSKNSSMWKLSLLKKLPLISARYSTLATFSASSQLRRDLISSGYQVTKITGFGQKREMICAHLENNPNFNLESSSGTCRKKQSILIVGAGLAGIITACKLAQRGFEVALYEENTSLCAEASGNDFGLYYPKLSNIYDSTCILHTTAFNYLLSELDNFARYTQSASSRLLNSPTASNNGLLYLISNNKSRLTKLTLEKLQIPAEYIEYLDSDSTAKFFNQSVDEESFFFKKAGSLAPKLLAEHYLSHCSFNKNIQIFFAEKITDLRYVEKKWAVSIHGKKQNKQYDYVVICSGHKLNQLLPQFTKNTLPIKGQIDLLEMDQATNDFPLCGNGYAIPVQQNAALNNSTRYRSWIGASFHRNVRGNKVTDADTLENINRARNLNITPDKNFNLIAARASTRLSSSDRLPIAGEFDLTKHTNDFESPENSSNGLFVNTAFGSHGITLIPLISEYIARLINKELLPFHFSLKQTLNPHRFIQRERKKQKNNS